MLTKFISYCHCLRWQHLYMMKHPNFPAVDHNISNLHVWAAKLFTNSNCEEQPVFKKTAIPAVMKKCGGSYAQLAY